MKTVLACALAFAAGALPLDAFADAPAAGTLPVPTVADAVTHHAIRVHGREIRYTATAGTILLTNDRDETTASVFYVAYVASGLGPTAHRPITFAYNGGPGASSALLEMGGFGPRTVVTDDAAPTHPAPYELVDNQDTLLGSTDLVFVDAVGTGFSRVAGHGTTKDFYGVKEDGRAFTQFIRRYITANDRWNSPKFLAGESYGTTRSCVLADMLQGDGIVTSGVILISSVLDFSTLSTDLGQDEAYWLFLPTEAAVAVYHHKIAQPADMAGFLHEVRAFAQGPYLLALAKGASLSASERETIAARLHAYTSLPLDYIERSNLRVPPSRFEKVLLGAEDRTIGRYDGRFSNADVDPIGADADTDPSSDAVFGAFTASFNRYVRDELGYRSSAKYEFLSYDVNRAWNWKESDNGDPGPLNVSAHLRDAMTQNAFLRVFSANGIYDLATPFFATEYSLGHLGLAPQLQAHIAYGYYPAGHMIYVNADAHAALTRDLEAFYHS